jgi:hypothetical protein
VRHPTRETEKESESKQPSSGNITVILRFLSSAGFWLRHEIARRRHHLPAFHITQFIASQANPKNHRRCLPSAVPQHLETSIDKILQLLPAIVSFAVNFTCI